jgi:hypothetical protein
MLLAELAAHSRVSNLLEALDYTRRRRRWRRRRAQTHWIVTEIAHAPTFCKAEERHQQYVIVDRIDVIARDCERVRGDRSAGASSRGSRSHLQGLRMKSR